jgi:hypothetical protein
MRRWRIAEIASSSDMVRMRQVCVCDIYGILSTLNRLEGSSSTNVEIKIWTGLKLRGPRLHTAADFLISLHSSDR